MATPTLPDEMLMAYADGRLDAAERARVEAALAADPALAARVQAQQALQRRLQQAFDPVLEEPVPVRLRATLGLAAPVIELRPARAPSRWPAGGWALAASLVLGVGLGMFGGRAGWPPPSAPIGLADGALVARGALDAALDRQPSGRPGNGLRMVLSFVDRDGAYCRGFVLEQARPLAGLACRDGTAWRLHTLVAADAAVSTELRPAATALPPLLLRQIDERIDGPALDAGAEAQALARGWRR